MIHAERTKRLCVFISLQLSEKKTAPQSGILWVVTSAASNDKRTTIWNKYILKRRRKESGEQREWQWWHQHKNRRKIERKEHVFYTMYYVSTCVCVSVYVSLRYRQPMQEMHVTYVYMLQMKKLYFFLLLFSYHHAIAMPSYARDQINVVEFALFYFLLFRCFFGIISTSHLTHSLCLCKMQTDKDVNFDDGVV